MTSSEAYLRRDLPDSGAGLRSQVWNILKKPVVYHSLFWVLYFTFNVIRWGSYHQDYTSALYGNLIEFPMHIWVAYLNLYYLIPRLLPKKYVQYIILITIGVFLAVAGRLLIEHLTQFTPHGVSTPYQYLMDLTIGEFYVQGFIATFKLLLDWGRSQKKMRELEKTNFKTELDFLRSQVQPHFFFNTLNNLYSLTLDKSDLAPNTVIKLSELMSYVIYDGKQKRVPLFKEVKYIQNYLDLEKLRFGNRLKTNLDIQGEIKDQKIAPLLLLPFIENSFKHGVGGKVEDINIGISLKVNGENVTFTVQNRKFEKLKAPAPNPYHHIGHNGIGIENIKRRLELIYESNYSLDIHDGPDDYSVTLKIPTYENALSDS